MFLLRRNLPWTWAGWHDLDTFYARPDENPIRPPWKSVNSDRLVTLTNNVLTIADGLSTPFEVGGVSYEKMPFTPSWGAEYDLNIDGAILVQMQFFAMAISSSWAKVGFNDLIEVPMVAIWRDVGSAVNNIRVIVYHSLAVIDTLAQTDNYDGLQNKTWYRVKIWIDEDRLVRVGINDAFLFQYWLPAQYASGPDRRALSFINQTTAPAYIKNYMLYDKNSDLQTKIGWTRQVVYDDFNRPDGVPNNGWAQAGNGGIVSSSWASTGSGSAGLLRDTGVTHGAHRVEAVINSPNDSNDCSLAARVKSDATEGMLANIYASTIYLSRFTGALTNPTMIDYVSTSITVPSGALMALCTNGECAWVEMNGVIVLMAHMNGKVPATNSCAGLRVEGGSGSWNDVRIKTAF